MASGRPRQEIAVGTIIGAWRIISRTSKRHNGNHKNYEYFYLAECVFCGHNSVRRVTRMREYPSHTGCPIKAQYRHEVAMKNTRPGDFKQWLDARIEALVDPARVKQSGEQSKKKGSE